MGKAQPTGPQTLTFSKEEIEALYLCVYSVQTPKYPTTQETARVAEKALLRETRTPTL